MKQFTKAKAIALHAGTDYSTWTNEEIVKLQLYQERLCVPFNIFHRALEQVLGRGVYSPEFADSASLIEEYEGLRSAPTFEEVVAMISPDKMMLIIAIEQEASCLIE